MYISNPTSSYLLKERFRSTLKFFIFLFFSVKFLYPQSPQYVFSEINASDGLSGNKVRSIGQLSDGRMVIITEGLVDIYNGSSFTYMHYNEDKDYELSDYSGYHRLYIGPNDGIWLKNTYSLKYIDMKKEKLITDVDQIFQKMGINEKVTDFFIDPNKDFWYKGESGKLFFKLRDKEKASVFIDKLPKNDPLYDLTVAKNQVFLFYRSGQVEAHHLTSKKIRHFKNSIQNKPYHNTLLVVPDKHYIYQLRNGDSLGIAHRLNMNSGEWEILLKTDYFLNTLSIDWNRNIWITNPKGIMQIDTSLFHKRTIEKLKLLNGDVINSEISTIFFDKNKGVWIGTLNRGLLYYHRDRFKFKNIGHKFFPHTSEKDIVINGFSEFEDKILVATDNGVFLYYPKTQKIERFSRITTPLKCRFIFTEDDDCWIGTSNGLYISNKKTFQKLKTPFSQVYQYLDASIHQYLLATDQGLFLLNSKNNAITQVTEKLAPIFNISRIDSNKYAGVSREGLFFYNLKEDRLQTAKTNTEIRFFHQKNQAINDLYTDSRGWLWTASQDGLSVWFPKKNKLKHFYAKDGLVNNSIQSIIEDDKQQIWVATSNGLSCVHISEEKKDPAFFFTNYNQYDGVVDYEFVKNSVLKMNNGSLLWGGLDGFNIFNPANNLLEKTKLEIPIFTQFELFGKLISPGQEFNGKTILDKAIQYTSAITLKHRQNFFSLSFSGLNYTNVSKTKYKYRLEGIDENWQEIAPDNGLGKASYTDLSPGDYTLKVTSSANGTIWSDMATLHIIILPPWWKTWPAYLGYIVLILFIIYLCFHLLLKFQKEKLKAKQSEELRTLKDQFFTNVSHELKTPLSLIITPLASILKTENSSNRSKLTKIHQSAIELLQLVNQLLDVRKIETTGKLSVNSDCCQLNQLLNNVTQPFDELAQHKGIRFKREISKEETLIFIDNEKFKKIVSNLLSNAFKFTPQEGKVSFIGELDGEILKIQVTDNGKGIAKEEVPKIFERYYRSNPEGENTGTGIGLHLVKSYLELLGGTVNVTSAPAKGSTFTVRIPVRINIPAQPKILTSYKDPNERFSILIVEDHPDFQDFLFSELKEDFNIYTAKNGLEGLEQVKKHHPDLVISDIMMPVMTGIILCHNIKSDIEISHIPVILLSARSSEESKLKGFEAKADAYMDKPFNLEILKQRIENLVQEQQSRKEVFKNSAEIKPDEITIGKTDSLFMEKALQKVHENMENTAYSVKQLSSDLNMDRTGLFRKIKAITGLSPTAFIRSIKLKHARQLLDEGKSVSEVSVKVGFSSLSYFGKCFQQEYGKKPSDYKN